MPMELGSGREESSMSGYGPTQQKKRAEPTPTNGTSARITMLTCSRRGQRKGPGARRTIVEMEP